MSYILDALKRAEAERERGAVPGLHSQQMARTAAEPTGGVRRTVGRWVAGSSLALVVLAAVVWFWPAPAPQAPVSVPFATAPVAPNPLPSLPAPAAPATLAPAAPKVEPKALPAQVSVATPANMSTAATTPVSASVPAPVSAPVNAGLPRPLPAASKATVSVAAIPAAPATQAVAPKVAPLSELPEELRRQVPSLVITGVVYSDSPSQSLLLVNKLVLTQGNLAAPEVMLERIHLHHAVFSFKGTQFTLSY